MYAEIFFGQQSRVAEVLVEEGSEGGSAWEAGEDRRHAGNGFCLHRAPPRGGTQGVLWCARKRPDWGWQGTPRHKETVEVTGHEDPLRVSEQKNEMGGGGNEARELI